VTSKMKLYNPTISRKTKRAPARITGYYTTPEAAEVLGVDPATLKYRRDAADAKAYWDLQGVEVTDKLHDILAKSHMLENGHHYYEQKGFKKFAKLYNARPKVLAARRRHLTFPTGTTQYTKVTVENQKQADNLRKIITTLLRIEGKVTVTVGV
jgi:hypothetical protein